MEKILGKFTFQDKETLYSWDNDIIVTSKHIGNGIYKLDYPIKGCYIERLNNPFGRLNYSYIYRVNKNEFDMNKKDCINYYGEDYIQYYCYTINSYSVLTDYANKLNEEFNLEDKDKYFVESTEPFGSFYIADDWQISRTLTKVYLRGSSEDEITIEYLIKTLDEYTLLEFVAVSGIYTAEYSYNKFISIVDKYVTDDTKNRVKVSMFKADCENEIQTLDTLLNEKTISIENNYADFPIEYIWKNTNVILLSPATAFYNEYDSLHKLNKVIMFGGDIKKYYDSCELYYNQRIDLESYNKLLHRMNEDRIDYSILTNKMLDKSTNIIYCLLFDLPDDNYKVKLMSIVNSNSIEDMDGLVVAYLLNRKYKNSNLELEECNEHEEKKLLMKVELTNLYSIKQPCYVISKIYDTSNKCYCELGIDLEY